MRVIIDTNVFYDGLLSSRMNSNVIAARKIISALSSDILQVVMNQEMLFEFLYVLNVQVSLVPKNSNRYTRAIATIASTVEKATHETHLEPRFITDPDDAMFIECAIDAHVPFIVSNDNSLKGFVRFNKQKGNTAAIQLLNDHHIQIYSPEDFVEHVL